MTEKTFTGNRRYPAAFTVTDDPRTHTLALQALIEGLNIAQRRTRDIANSFVRLEELEQIGLIQLNGSNFNVLSVLTDAPSDGSEYVRKDGEWAVATGGGGSVALDDLTDVTLGTPALNEVLTFNGTVWESSPLPGGSSSLVTYVRGATWVRSTAIATPVADVVIHIPKACTIVGWAVYGRGPLAGQDVAGSCEIDIWRSASGAFPPTVANSIVASDKPTITAAKAAVGSALTGWTTTLNVNDALLFRLDSCSTFAQVFLQLFLQETV